MTDLYLNSKLKGKSSSYLYSGKYGICLRIETSVGAVIDMIKKDCTNFV